MTTEAAEIKQTAHTWLDALSESEIFAVAPILHSLSGLLSAPFLHSSALAIAPVQSNARAYEGTECNNILERQLERALETQDVQELRDHIASCLNLVRQNTSTDAMPFGRGLGMEREASMHVSEASQALASAADALTGLPTRPLFERIVTNTIAEGKEGLIALFKVERLPYINKRFGRATGDEIVLFVAQYLAEKLPNSGLFIRWSGPAFASMLSGKAASKEAALEMRAISRKQLSKSIDVDGRPVMLPISCSCMVETISVTSSPEKTFAKMDEFLLAHVTA